MSPKLIPTHEVRKTLQARARPKILALLFAYGQSFHGVATPIPDTPRDDLSIRKSNVSYAYRVERYRHDVRKFFGFSRIF